MNSDNLLFSIVCIHYNRALVYIKLRALDIKYEKNLVNMLLRLQRKLNRKIGDEEYYKWYIPVSPDIVEQLKWKKGDDLHVKVSGKRLMIQKE